MEERQADAVLGGHLQQFHLGPLQAPARGGDAAVLATVRIAQHHHLHIPARGQVRAVDRVGQQVAQGVGATLEVVHRFEQRGDIQRHRAGVVDQPAPTGQGQYGEHVAAVVRHRNDVAAQRVGTVAAACIGQCGEHRVQALTALLGARRQRLLAAGERRQPGRAGDRIGRVPNVLAIQHAGQCAAVHARLLAHVQPRQVEAEGAHPPQQATHREAAGMVALVGVQAVQDQLDVVLEFLRRRIGAVGIVQGGLHARAHAVVEQAVRHVGMAWP